MYFDKKKKNLTVRSRVLTWHVTKSFFRRLAFSTCLGVTWNKTVSKNSKHLDLSLLLLLHPPAPSFSFTVLLLHPPSPSFTPPPSSSLLLLPSSSLPASTLQVPVMGVMEWDTFPLLTSRALKNRPPVNVKEGGWRRRRVNEKESEGG
jgi:hypothetical protein